MFRKLPSVVQQRVQEAVGSLKDDPRLGKPLQGPMAGKFAIRVGDYRVVYTLSEGSIYLLAVGHRRKIYQR